jgi:hypothetical protein
VIEHPKILTRPRHARSAAGVPSGLRPGPLAGDCLSGAARRWRRRRFVASFTDREDEDPAELPDELHALTTAPPARATPAATLAHACNRCLPADRHLDQATARPIGCRCAVWPSPWLTCRRSPSRCCSMSCTPLTTAPPSTSTRLQPRLASHPTPRPGHGTPDRLPVRRLAVALARLPAIAFPVLLDTGAVVASRPVSPIERTEDPAELPVIEHRHSTGHATARPIGCRCAVSPSPWPACRRSPSRCCSTLAPSSLRGRLQRSRERRPGSTAGDREPPEILTRPRHARSAAGTPSRRRPGSLAGDRLPGAAR